MATLPWRRMATHGDVAASLRVVQTVRESGRLSESRADCQRVGQTVGGLVGGGGGGDKNGKPFFSVVTTTFLVYLGLTFYFILRIDTGDAACCAVVIIK